MVGVRSRTLLRPRGTPRRDEGQSLVEMALILPILLALLVGIFEFGRSWNIYQVVTNAAREGARKAVIPTSSTAQVDSVVDAYLVTAALDPDLADVSIDGVELGVGEPAIVRVRYPYQFQFIGPIVDMLDGDSEVPGSVMLSSTATMRNE